MSGKNTFQARVFGARVFAPVVFRGVATVAPATDPNAGWTANTVTRHATANTVTRLAVPSMRSRIWKAIEAE